MDTGKKQNLGRNEVPLSESAFCISSLVLEYDQRARQTVPVLGLGTGVLSEGRRDGAGAMLICIRNEG